MKDYNDYKMIYRDKIDNPMIEKTEEEPEEEKSIQDELMQTGEVWLAINCRPRRYVWEEVGFEFQYNKIDGHFIKAVLPEGWYTRPGENLIYTYFYDADGNQRGRMITVLKPGDTDVRMELYCKYRVVHATEDYKTAEIYFGNSEEKLFVAGTCKDDLISPDIIRLEDMATRWAEENYPDYRHPGAYWSKEQSHMLKPGQTKKEEK